MSPTVLGFFPPTSACVIATAVDKYGDPFRYCSVKIFPGTSVVCVFGPPSELPAFAIIRCVDGNFVKLGDGSCAGPFIAATKLSDCDGNSDENLIARCRNYCCTGCFSSIGSTDNATMNALLRRLGHTNRTGSQCFWAVTQLPG
ncbi:MAG: hypothetical protein LBB38_03330 [Puniceicoccales bacterium]|jgi:hypothetical protein|nr:hypothetical protein [Puniceicoccales bacterium]